MGVAAITNPAKTSCDVWLVSSFGNGNTSYEILVEAIKNNVLLTRKYLWS
jgi:hypothetical protein